MNFINSQLRQDLVSGDWIVISPGRQKRPHQLISRLKRKKSSKKKCPFENIDKPILIYGEDKWRLAITENKYPAFTHTNTCATALKNGRYAIMEAVGHHELLITRDHDKNFIKLPVSEARQVFEAFRDRYLMLLNDPCVNYISIFHNWGAGAGASVYHPHYQIIAIPVVPPDINHSLTGSSRYYKEHKKCVHCVMIEEELKHKKRVLFENDGAIAFAPFVSREPFEIRIFPKKHLPYFENTLDIELDHIVEALRFCLKKIEKNLKDPDYNFFIHTAPIKNKENYNHYHWHIEIIPKISIKAGFELGTGISINVVDPDEAAAMLKK